jgi:hypothetical protein
MTRPYFLSDALENTHPQLSRFGDELMARFPRRPPGRLHHFRHRPGPERFIHLLDQYVGSQEDNRYTLGTQFLATVTISADNILRVADILGPCVQCFWYSRSHSARSTGRFQIAIVIRPCRILSESETMVSEAFACRIGPKPASGRLLTSRLLFTDVLQFKWT